MLVAHHQGITQDLLNCLLVAVIAWLGFKAWDWITGSD